MPKKYLCAAVLALSATAPAESAHPQKETGDAMNQLPISAALHTKNSHIALRSDVKLRADEAMRSALTRLIEQARDWKGNAVVRIASYYNWIEHASATDYECRVDAARAVVG
jgi:uncharacterized protein YbjQ (UPF0145 family)